ncbi:hypothetical protein GCM10023350_28900 [Nocardioides endophyticus]|uniref:Transposase n=1 Tax=Nocardioides endophyticus TaxID=1353775 RepID=A0ABP8Z004_9ACTN
MPASSQWVMAALRSVLGSMAARAAIEVPAKTRSQAAFTIIAKVTKKARTVAAEAWTGSVDVGLAASDGGSEAPVVDRTGSVVHGTSGDERQPEIVGCQVLQKD